MNSWSIESLRRFADEMAMMAAWCAKNHKGCDCVRLYQKRATDALKEISRGS